MTTSTLVNVLIALVVLGLIWKFLLPLLPTPFGTIALVILVVLAIVWLLRLGGLA